MKAKQITLKMRKFALAFVGEANGNGTEAARIAGYKGESHTLEQVAYENLRKPEIRTLIKELREKAEQSASGKILSATETLAGLTKIALADIAEVFEPDGTFDLQKAKERNVSRLIKSLSFDKDTGRLTKLELHNAHGAHQDLGKYHKLFTDRVELAGADLDAEIARRLAAMVTNGESGALGETETGSINN